MNTEKEKREPENDGCLEFLIVMYFIAPLIFLFIIGIIGTGHTLIVLLSKITIENLYYLLQYSIKSLQYLCEFAIEFVKFIIINEWSLVLGAIDGFVSLLEDRRGDFKYIKVTRPVNRLIIVTIILCIFVNFLFLFVEWEIVTENIVKFFGGFLLGGMFTMFVDHRKRT